MATNAVVVSGTLPQSNGGTVDLTSTSFGTVDAAIVFITNANTTNNPENDLDFAVGFWDGTTIMSMSNWCDDAVTTSDCERGKDNNELSFESLLKYGCANITDGIRLTKNFGTVSTDRYVGAILINGLDNASVTEHSLGFTTSATTVTTSHNNNAVFSIGIGGNGGNEARFAIGCAHFDGTTVTQGAVLFQSQNGQSTTNTDGRTTHTYVGGELSTSSVQYQYSLGNFTSTSFDVTTTANAGNDSVMFLAMDLPDPGDFWVDIIDAATTTGNDATTGLGFQPEVVGLLSEISTTLDSTSAGRTHSFGAGDGTTTFCHFAHDENGVTTVNANSERGTNIINVTDDAGTDDFIASLSSLDSDGFTLNYSDAATGATKILAFAFGDSTAGGATNVALTGQGATSQQGTLSVTGDALVSLTGQESTSQQGTLTVSIGKTVSLTGQESTAAQGTPTVQGNCLVGLTGQESTAQQGAVSVSIAGATIVQITGQSSTVQQGTPTVQGNCLVGLTGQASTSQQGAVTVETSKIISLTGQAANSAQGSISVSAGTVFALTGQGSSIQQGILSIIDGDIWTVQPNDTTNWTIQS